MSSDGTKLIAAVGGGQIYVSSDSGANWAPRESSRSWLSVAISADGTKLVAADSGGFTGGQIYISILGDETTTGTAGAISGKQFEAIALQYIGGNRFIVLSNTGLLTVS
jgi:hypothetical protein